MKTHGTGMASPDCRTPRIRTARQRQLTRMGNAAAGAGLARLMGGDTAAAREWFARAVERYRESYELAPPGSWGRPIANSQGPHPGRATGTARSAKHAGRSTRARRTRSRRSGATPRRLALLVLGRDEEARVLADGLRTRDDFPAPVADALASIAAEDLLGYIEAVEAVLESFETRVRVPRGSPRRGHGRSCCRRSPRAATSPPSSARPCSP